MLSGVAPKWDAMDSARISLKVKILLALGAITITHLLFYAVPRWWHSHPRFYPDAYAEAVGVLKEEFGEGAVEKGIVSIPKAPISVPYRGQAMLSGLPQRQMLYISLTEKDAYIVVDPHPAPSNDVIHDFSAARLSPERARELWARFAYLEAATGECDLVADTRDKLSREDYALKGTLYDYTWSRSNAAIGAMESTDSIVANTMGDLVRDRLRARAVADAAREYAPLLSDRPEVVATALEAMIRASSPARNNADCTRIWCFVDAYAVHAEEKALPLLKEIRSHRNGQWRTIAQGLPLVGAKLAQWHRVGYEGVPDVSSDIWAIELLRGKTEQERLKAFEEAAFPKEGWGALYAAAQKAQPGTPPFAALDRLFEAAGQVALRSPARWRDLLVEHYAEIPGYERGRYFLDEPGQMSGDERYVRLIASDPAMMKEVSGNGEPLQVLAMVRVYKATGDPAIPRALEQMARARMRSDAGTADFILGALVGLGVRDKAVVDAPRLAREMLGQMRSRGAACYWCTVEGMATCRDSEYVPLLQELLSAPESVLGPECAGDERLTSRQVAAWALASIGGDAAHDVLLGYLESRAPENEWNVALASVEGLRQTGGARILPRLEAVLAREAANPTIVIKQSNYGPLRPEEWLRLEDWLRRAVATLTTRSAADPAAAYLALDVRNRGAMWGEDLSQVFTIDQLKALLADDRCKDARPTILRAVCLKAREMDKGER